MTEFVCNYKTSCKHLKKYFRELTIGLPSQPTLFLAREQEASPKRDKTDQCTEVFIGIFCDF